MNRLFRFRFARAGQLAILLAAVANAGCGASRLQNNGADAQADATPGRDGGAIDSAADALVCPTGKPLPRQPCFTCAPLPSGTDGGCGGPIPGLWGFDGGPTPDGGRYPLGCHVALPVENPFYPGGPQYCSCEALPMTDPRWLCPI
jgi:hypothetical protein